jgi:hypothetical protein
MSINLKLANDPIIWELNYISVYVKKQTDKVSNLPRFIQLVTEEIRLQIPALLFLNSGA